MRIKKEELEKRLVDLSKKFENNVEIKGIIDKLLDVTRGKSVHGDIRFYDPERETTLQVTGMNEDAAFFGPKNDAGYREEWLLKITTKGFILVTNRPTSKTSLTVGEDFGKIFINSDGIQYEDSSQINIHARYSENKDYDLEGHLISDEKATVYTENDQKKETIMTRRTDGDKVYMSCKGEHKDLDGTYEVSGKYVEEYKAGRRDGDGPHNIFNFMLEKRDGYPVEKVSDDFLSLSRISLEEIKKMLKDQKEKGR